ncbi:histidine phosphatase family protein [Haloechinothrix sp. LS1_15]|uniref:histidine phosphatase family protein n=1 Tax=Haloechinothrix sp. LS1_15 TaxID=2652248 RepID=UPI002944591E|nr:histidine phosphatase family protein [Haloechinothrix sp. LS1_15]MDV6012350.1 histidine phosphatase family protein [Haloechinothrix sp. LS1_15]
MKLKLVRHAESTANVRKAINTKVPGPPLTDLGKRQAEELAERLRDEPVEAVYCSLATRAQQTAAPVAALHELDLQVIDGVHEIFVGELEDVTDREGIEAYARIFYQWIQGELQYAMPGGESGFEVRDRFVTAITQIRNKHEQEHPDGTVVVVSHGGIMRLGVELLAENVPQASPLSGLIANTGTIELATLDGGGWRCVAWDGFDL